MRAIIPPKTVLVEMSEFEAKTLISLFNKISGPIGETNPTYITSQLRDALLDGLGECESEEDYPPVFMQQLGPLNVFLASSEADLPKDLKNG